MESWSSIALAKDWYPPSRLQNAPSWHYVHSDQWRYEKEFTDYHTVPQHTSEKSTARGHSMDMQVRAVRQGWLPFYPQFPESPLDVASQARAAGAKSADDVANWIAQRLKNREMKFSVEDPDAEENWPRVWFIWRGNALMSSAKGHEYFLRHYLGTHDNSVGEDMAADSVKDVVWHEHAPQGKMDLVVDLNFRMDTSALYSDIILPAATWYEKADLNSTDMHSFIHPLSPAVPPCWESKSDWQIFRAVAKKFSELAERHFPEPVEDVVAAPLAHDSPAEVAQADLRQWIHGEIDAIPGKTMPAFKVVSRDYKNVYNQYVSYGPLVRKNGLGAHGTSLQRRGCVRRISRRRGPRSTGAAIPILRCGAIRKSATPSCTLPRRPTANWPTARTRTWKRRRACRWSIWPRRTEACVARLTTCNASRSGSSTAPCGRA